MRHVPQLRQDDCGVACVAMLASVSYDTALGVFRFRPRQSRRTTSRQIIDAMRALGFDAVEPHPQGGWSVRDRLLPLNNREPPLNAIIKETPFGFNAGRRFHWCVYDRASGDIWDPADKKPLINWKISRTMTHYIPFWRRY